MKKYSITSRQINAFRCALENEERSELTVKKYLRDVRKFQVFIDGAYFDKQSVIEYKQELEQRFKVSSANSMLAALNRMFEFCGWSELRVRAIKVQKSLYSEPERELSRDEYSRLLQAARQSNNERLGLVMQAICSTGIRVSELRYFTVESLKRGKTEVVGKGKRRMVFFTRQLSKRLLAYAKQEDIASGPIFLSSRGNPLNRHSIWADMKSLCNDAGVAPQKVFPHNLRHLFARTFYALEKDLLRLADILGHSSVNTTRIYTAECGATHIRLLERLPLLC